MKKFLISLILTMFVTSYPLKALPSNYFESIEMLNQSYMDII